MNRSISECPVIFRILYAAHHRRIVVVYSRRSSGKSLAGSRRSFAADVVERVRVFPSRH